MGFSELVVGVEVGGVTGSDALDFFFVKSEESFLSHPHLFEELPRVQFLPVIVI